MKITSFIVTSIILMIATAGTVFPLCMRTDPTYTVATVNNSTTALAVTITGNAYLLSEQNSTTVDTVYQDSLLSRLTTAFAASEAVVIAKATRAVKFIPKLVNVGDRVFESESVTVEIERVFKGTMKTEWNFIHTIPGNSHTLYFDSAMGVNMVLMSRISHDIPGYSSIVNQRILLFLDKNDLPNGDVFNLPYEKECTRTTNAYLIDSLNRIYFDGFTYLASEKTVLALPELKVPLEQFTHEIGNKSGVIAKPFTHASRVTGDAAGIITYNLLGKRLPAIAGQNPRHGTGIYLKVATTPNGRVVRTLLGGR
jgi:hypothetical protein